MASLWLLALGALAAGCWPRTVPILGVGPLVRDDPSVLDSVLDAAARADYPPTEVDAEHGRFVVTARTDRQGTTRFVVQCYADGWVSIVPEGPRVVREGDRLRMPDNIRREYEQLTVSLEHALWRSRR